MIEVIKVNYSGFEDFHILVQDGVLLKEINSFLIDISLHGGRKNNKLSKSSQKQYAYVFKQLFDYFTKKKLLWNKIVKKDFADLIEYLDSNKTTSRERINYLSSLWVRFFLWCRLNKIEVSLDIEIYKGNINLDKDDDFLAHTKVNKISFIYHEFTFKIPGKRKIRHLSAKSVKALLLELKKIDLVYYVVAYFMVTSGLRINGALQLKNNDFPHYLEVDHLEWLTYNYIPKGYFDRKETITLNYSLKAWEHISKIFAFSNNRRSEKFYNKYKVWPKKYFLKSNGEELKDYDIWNRFKKVSDILKLKITPHMLRHTYAVLFVLKYSKKKGLEPSSRAFFWDVHKQLQKNLGHVNISTTMSYCEAAYDYVSINLLDDLAIEFIS